MFFFYFFIKASKFSFPYKAIIYNQSKFKIYFYLITGILEIHHAN